MTICFIQIYNQKKTKNIMRRVALFLIIATEFCERFCYYGLRALIFPFLHDHLGLSFSLSKGLAHAFFFMSFLFAVIFGFLSDVIIGHYNTIMSLSLAYLIGTFLLIISAYLDSASIFIIAIFIVAMGTGGIKPCISIFGGDQFRNTNFFSLFYFSINCGAMVSIVTLPIISKTSYTFAFAFPCVLVSLAIMLFFSGTRLYIIKKPDPKLKEYFINIIKSKIKNETDSEYNYEIDISKEDEFKEIVGGERIEVIDQTRSEERATPNQINSKLRKKRLNMNLPPIVENSENTILLETNYSSSSEADEKMGKSRFYHNNSFNTQNKNSRILYVMNDEKSLKFNHFDQLDSDQLQDKYHSMTPEQKDVWLNDNFNGFAQKLNFQHEFQDEKSEFISPQKRIESAKNVISETLNYSELPTNNQLYQSIESDQSKTQDLKNDMKNVLGILNLYLPIIFFWTIYDQQATSWTDQASTLNLNILGFKLIPSQMQVFNAILTLIFIPLFSRFTFDARRKMVFGFYLGASSFFTAALVEHFKTPNTSILIQIPQYVLLTAGEVLLSVTGLEFSFTMAPEKFKSFVLAIWLFMASIGNMIVAFVTKLNMFSAPIGEYLFWGCLAFIASRVLNMQFKKLKK